MRSGLHIPRHRRLAGLLVLTVGGGCIDVADRDLSLATDGSPGGSVTDASPVGPPHDAASPGDAGDGSVSVGFDFQAPPGDTDADRPIPLPDGGGGGGSDGGVAPPGPDAGDPGPVIAPQNAFGPAARLIALEMPATPEAATAAGCDVVGRWKGAFLHSTFNFSGRPLSDYLHPNPDGDIEVIILARAEAWIAGEAVSQAGSVDLRLNTGRQTPNLAEFEIDPDRRETLFSNTHVADDGSFETEPATSTFMMPLLYGGNVPFTVQQSTLRGRLEVDGPGLAVREGFIEGYYTKHEYIEALL